MKTSRGSRALTVLIAGAGITVLASGSAFAYWTTVGAGAGTAAATTAAPLTTGTATAAPGLYPGGSSNGSIVITNPNPFAVKVTSATFAAASADRSGCTTTGVTFAATTPPSLSTPLTIPAKGTQPLSYTVQMSNASDDACQGATFTSALSLSGQS